MLTIRILDFLPGVCRQLLIRVGSSERVLQSQLNLAHREGRRTDDAEALMGGIGGRSWKCRTRQDISVRRTP